MNHKVGFNKLSKAASHRRAMIRNMATSLFKHGRIQTTKAKAKAVQVTAEKMITRAKVDSVHNRRVIGKDIKDEGILAKIFTEIGPEYVERKGGYTRIIKMGHRQGDAAEMVLLELVKDEEEAAGKKKAKKKTAAKTEKKAEEKPVKAKKAEIKKETVEVEEETVAEEAVVKEESIIEDSVPDETASKED